MPVPIAPNPYYQTTPINYGYGYGPVYPYSQLPMQPSVQTTAQTPVQPPAQQNRQVIQMIPVDSIEEVKSYPVSSTTYFFDKVNPVFYIKDPTSLRIFDYTERDTNQNQNDSKYVTREEFDKLYKMVDDLTK